MKTNRFNRPIFGSKSQYSEAVKLWHVLCDDRLHKVQAPGQEGDACQEWCEVNCHGDFLVLGKENLPRDVAADGRMVYAAFTEERDAVLFKIFFG
jgi:hypothetical protein